MKTKNIPSIHSTLDAHLDDYNLFHPRNCFNKKDNRYFKLYSTDARIIGVSKKDVPNIIKGKLFDKTTKKTRTITFHYQGINNKSSLLYHSKNRDYEIKIRNVPNNITEIF